MNASIVDLRYKMSEVLDALARRERVTIFYHGKAKGVIVPAEERPKSKAPKHPFFGRASGEKKAVEQVMGNLRGGTPRVFDTDLMDVALGVSAGILRVASSTADCASIHQG